MADSELGHNHVDTGADLQQGNYISAVGPFSVADGGAIVAAFLHVRAINTSKKFRVALYADNGGVPGGGALLASSAEGSLDATGWAEVAMSAYTIAPSTNYWIVVICDGNWAYYYSTVTNGMRGYAARTYTDGFPATFPTGGATYNEHPAAYFTYTSGGPITGGLSKTLDGIGKSLAGKVVVKGAVAKTLAGIGLNSSGLVESGEDPMPKTTTWTDAVADDDWSTAGNWDNGVAVDTDTVVIDSETVPTANRPGAGTFNFVILSGRTADPAVWLNGATLGTVLVQGNLTQAAARTFPALVTIEVGGQIGDGIWDFNAGLVGDADFIGSGGIVTITGNVNLTSATWNVAAGSTLTIDNAGALTLNLGTAEAIPNLTVTVNKVGTVTLGGPMNVKGLVPTAGTLDLNGQTVTLGTSGIAAGGGTLNLGGLILCAATGTLDFDGLTVTNAGTDVFSGGVGKVFTIDHLTVAAPLRTWCGCIDGTHNAAGAVEFHPGPPSALCRMGMG